MLLLKSTSPLVKSFFLCVFFFTKWADDSSNFTCVLYGFMNCEYSNIQKWSILIVKVLKKKLFNQVNFWISKSTLQKNDYLSRRLKTIEDHWIPLETIEDHWRPLETIEFVAYIQQLVNWKRVWGCKSEFWLKKNLFISSPLCLWN